MNEIEQMYRNAGVERKKPACVDCFLDRHSCNRTYDECPELYPSFTAEKQLEVIKVLAIEHFVANYVPKRDVYILSSEDFAGTKRDFSEALAELVNYLWQDLTEDEKQKITNILKG